MQHRHTTQNNWDTPFDFTSENYEHVSLAATQFKAWRYRAATSGSFHELLALRCGGFTNVMLMSYELNPRLVAYLRSIPVSNHSEHIWSRS